MRFPEWVEKEGRGVLKRLEHESRVGYMTLQRMARGALVSLRTAERVSPCTRGEVSIQEMMLPAELVAEESAATEPPAAPTGESNRAPILPTPPGVPALAKQTAADAARMTELVAEARRAFPSDRPPALDDDEEPAA